MEVFFYSQAHILIAVLWEIRIFQMWLFLDVCHIKSSIIKAMIDDVISTPHEHQNVENMIF